MIHQVFFSAANGLPLNANLNERKFKLLFLDVGLVQAAGRLGAELLMAKDVLTINRGQIGEQFVGQELLTLDEAYWPGNLYYWERSKPGSTAEVDYLLNIDAHLLPVEVKAGVTGRLKSLRVFMEEKKSLCGLQISQQSLRFKESILSIPLYMIHQLPRLVREYTLNS